MMKSGTSLREVLEPFLLGVSCLVGRDDLSFLLSHTTVSVKIKYILFVCIAIVVILVPAIIDNCHPILVGFHSIYTILVIFSVIHLRENAAVLALVISMSFIGSVAIKSRSEVVSHLTHWYYTVISAALCIFVCYRIRSRQFTILMIISLAYILPLLVVYSISYYSTSRTGLLCFILGMFTSRFLPSFFWFMIRKKYEYAYKVELVARALAICRFLSSLLSMFLALSEGKFNLSMDGSIIVSFKNAVDELKFRFTELGGHKDFWYREAHFSWEVSRCYKPIAMGSLIPLLAFLSYVVTYLAFPPSVHSLKFCYSYNTMSSLSCVSMIFHLLGSCTGICCPLSVSTNGYKFYLFNYLVCIAYILVTKYLYHYWKLFPRIVLYPFVMISDLVSGYSWAYNLGVFVNSVLKKGCKYEELKRFVPCCGDKINNVCYCKLPVIVNELNKVSYELGNITCSRGIIIDTVGIFLGYFGIFISSMYRYEVCRSLNMFSCSKSFVIDCDKSESLVYSNNGQNAILILYDLVEDCSELCKSLLTCGNDCSNSCTKGNCYCLKLVGVYKLDSVTTSSCADCHLTVRLELSKSPIDVCNGCESSPCLCQGQKGKCCCIAIQCCGTGSCNGNDCCVKLCCCKSCIWCTCANTYNGVRVFVGYKESTKCCIKEIKPNLPYNFDGDTEMKSQFDIDGIFISDCCHTELQVDLHCKMKNNFFRLSGINYPRKLDIISSIILISRMSKCCKKQNGKCCCPYRELVKVCILRNGSQDKCEEVECPCSGGDSNECPKTCKLVVSKNSSYVKKIDVIRVRLVIVSLLVFIVLFLTTGSIVHLVRIKRSKSHVFMPNKSYSDLVGPFKSNKFNTEEQIVGRISSLLQNGTVGDDVIKIKKTQVDKMLIVFKKYMGNEDSEKISNYVVYKSNSFLKSCKKVEMRKVNVDLVIWSYSIGMVFKYVMLLFFDIQKFFVYWEEIWSIEYLNYRKFMKNAISEISRKSTCSLYKIDVRKMNNEKLDCLATNRLQSWNNILVELKEFGRLIDEETDLYEERLPLKIGERLEFYVERWYHRLDFIKRWGVREANIFNWDPFITEYNKISSWVEELSPFLETDSEVKVKIKDLNKGTKIFVNRKLK